jgi:cytochrome c oxidase subunit 3
MPAVWAPTRTDRLQSGQGRGGLQPPQFGGGGEHGPGDSGSEYEGRLYRARLAVALILGSISVVFITATVGLIVWQSSVALDEQTRGAIHEWIPVTLPVRLLLWNTIVLLFSSITIEAARRSVVREMLFAPVHAIAGIAPEKSLSVWWMALTVFLGSAFLAGQYKAWQTLVVRGFHLSTVGTSPVFYVLTGGHAVHLSAGIIILLYAAGASVLSRPLERRRIAIEVAAWYWHFMGILWLAIFALLYFGY